MIIESRDYKGSEQPSDHLKRAYLELCLEVGQKNVSPTLIAKHTSYSRRSFYRYYKDVESLRAEAIEDALPRELCLNVYATKNDIALENASDEIIAFFENRPLATSVFLGENVDPYYENELTGLLSILFRALIERTYDLTPDDLACLTEYLTSARMALIRMWARNRCSASLSRMNVLADNLFERGFWCDVARANQPDQARLTVTKEDLQVYPWFR